MNIIILGGGKTSYFLAKNFSRQNHHVSLVLSDPEESLEFSRQLRATIFLGEGTDPKTLESAGARNADILLSLAPFDHKNLVACQIAREEFDIPRIIALVNDPENEEIFSRLGIPTIFSVTRVIAGLLEEQTELQVITNLMALAKGKINVTQAKLPENSPAVGKSLKELSVPGGFLLAAIIRNDQVVIPKGDTVLQANDQLIIIGQVTGFAHAMKMLIGEK